jgi:maleylacetate reductase
MIVRRGLGELPELLREIGVERPLLVSSPRWDDAALPVEAAAAWREIPSDRIADAARAAAEAGAGGIVAVGGGSAIDTAKAISAEAALPLVSVPTTYSGAEWTPFFGIRDRERRSQGGGSGARLAGIVLDADLTLGLPRAETVGTALNALAHAAEALYVAGRNEEADRHALAGARLIAEWLPRVVEAPRDREARARLLEGAAEAGAALAGAGLGLGHALAQALGGRYGLPHGALNALCLPPALRFNEPVVPEAVARFGDAIGAAGDAAGAVVELARLGGYERLRDLGVPREELDEVAAAAAARPGARANPRPATPAEAAELLRSIW